MVNGNAAALDHFELARQLRDEKRQSQNSPAASIEEGAETALAIARGNDLAGLLLKQNIRAATQSLQESAAAFSQSFAQKMSAQASYVIWKTAIYNIPDTIGLSLFLLVITNVHYLFKTFGIPPFAKLLCKPGEDGMVGMLPPSKVSISVVQLVYKWTNVIALIAIDCLLLLVSTLVFLLFFGPPLLVGGAIYSITQLEFGQLFDFLKIFFELFL